jgi:hypothetical protein
MQQKKQDAKVTLDSSYFAFLCLSTFDTKQFIHGHPQVYLHEEIVPFDANFQKQLSFNIGATCATYKKFTLMHKAHASWLRDVDLNVTPTSFSCDSTDCHELFRYVLKDLLSCTVGCWINTCICSSAKGNPTEELYLDQAKHVVDWQKKNGIATESWWMDGDSFYVIQGTISRATFHDEI